MTEHETFPGKPYVVTSKAGCTITDASGELEETCEPGKQKVIFAPSEKLFTSAPASVRETFNRAALALRLLGGGVKSDLPAGYLRAEFLESTGTTAKMTVACPVQPYMKWQLETMHAVQLLKQHGRTQQEGINSGLNSFQWATYSHLSSDSNWRQSLFIRGGGLDANFDFASPTEWGDFKRIKIYISPSVRGGELNGVRKETTSARFTISAPTISLWGTSDNSHVMPGKKKTWKLLVDDKPAYDMTAALDQQGVPCMYDRVSKQAVYNSSTGQFIAGFTLSQACKLGAHLPEGGGALTISLPTGYEQDAAVAESLETARARGWTLTIQTYTPEAEATATTFGMRRVWVRRTQDEQGAYVDADGTRWAVDWCVDMLTPDGSTPEAHGYELYRSTEAAVAYWELEPWAAPEEEELLTTESL